MRKVISGVFIVIVIFFIVEGVFNLLVLCQQVQCQFVVGNGIFCGGINGEFFVFNEEEKIVVVRICVEEVVGCVLVVVYIGEVFIWEMCWLGQQIVCFGVDVVLVIILWFVFLKQEELINYYMVIVDVLSVLFFFYNIFVCIGNIIVLEIVCQLVCYENIVGIKDSVGSYDSLKGFFDVVCDIDGFDVLNGLDLFIYQGFVDGCLVCILGFVNVVFVEINVIWLCFYVGDIVGLCQVQEQVMGLCIDLYKVVFLFVVVKKVLQLMGYEVGDSCYVVQFSDYQLQQICDIIVCYLV